MDSLNRSATAFLTTPAADNASSSAKYNPTRLTLTLTLLLLTALITRTYSSRYARPKILPDGSLKPPEVPYWLPLLGHLPNMAWDAAAFTQSLREKYTKGIFTLNFGGLRHHVIYKHTLATTLLNHRDGKVGFENVVKRIMVKIFGFPASEFPIWDAAGAEIMACYKHILSEPGLGQMVDRTSRGIRENVMFLASFSGSLVDQTAWERVASVELSKNTAGEEVVEASFLPLIKDFCAHIANPAITGTNFLEKNPDFFADLWTLDRGFMLLGAGLPRWTPLPSVTRAHIAKKRILEKLEEFHRAMEKEAKGEDPGPDWRDLDDVSSLVKARVEEYRKYGFSIRARAAIEHSLMWAANANSNALVFWMLCRIYADKELLDKVREEIKPYVRVVQPKQELAVPELPRFETFDVDALATKCPLLKSCYVECMRLDVRSWSLRVVQEDFVLQSREKDAQGWSLQKGDCVHAAHDLHSTDPAYYPDPMVWKGDRHIRNSDDGKKGTADLGSIRPYGGGSSMCKGRAFALKEIMAFTAAIVAVWDIEPQGGEQWKMPKPKQTLGVNGTSDDMRVWLKRRQLPQEG